MLHEPTVPIHLHEPRFVRRAEPAELPELMDQPCSYEEFRACIKDLEQVNRLTRAYAPTLDFLERILGAWGNDLPRPLRILDVGCGGGDMLREIAHWSRKHNIPVELTGIDLNPHSTRAAREFSAHIPDAARILWVNADVFYYAPPEGIDIVLSSLFTHHLSSTQIVRFIEWMDHHTNVGWYINDLRRSQRAAWWFRALPVIFRWHRFIRHDGPVSIQRAFRDEDWTRLLGAAGIPPGSALLEHNAMSRLCVARLK